MSHDLSDVRFLTVAEVADMMRVSKMTVYRMVHSGELPADPLRAVVPRAGIGRRGRPRASASPTSAEARQPLRLARPP